MPAIPDSSFGGGRDRDDAASIRLPGTELEDVASELFERRGVPPDDARLVARHLVRADARGVGSHGLLRLDFYLPKLDAGTLDPAGRLALEHDAGAVSRFSGNNGMGQVIATRAMLHVIERARRHGLAAALVRRSNHFGIAQLYTLLAAEQGLVGAALTNASPAMAPTGGAEKLIGNNPWSVAAPSAGGVPVVVDMANTVVARGKILAAQADGRPIPEGWALDGDGRPTTDATAALAGVVLPLGGYKGYALSLAVDLLTGVLGGGGWLDDVGYPGVAERVGNVSHLFVALDPGRLALDDYPARVRDAVARIKRVRRAAGVEEIFLPGELEHRRELTSRERGVPLSRNVLAMVERHARLSGVAVPWAAP